MADISHDSEVDSPLLGRLGPQPETRNRLSARYARRRAQARELLSSRPKHYATMGLVALDVTSIFADIFIALVSCDWDAEPWMAQTRDALHLVGLLFSSLFLAELLLTVWAFGLRFFADWFHCFDAFIISASFTIDLLTHGVLEEIASLVIVLRLWRFVKIVEELTVGASERMEDLLTKSEELEKENAALRAQLQAHGRP